METILQHIQFVLAMPADIINGFGFLPEWMKPAIILCITFIPWLYFLYYLIELLERFVLTHIGPFVKLSRRIGALVGITASIIPECGYTILASTFYARKMISKGTLLAFLIACSDEALPLLFMDLSKAAAIIPLIIIKSIVAVIVAVVIDLIFVFNTKIENSNPVNLDVNEPGCCHHKLMTVEHPPFWWLHPLSHTFNVFLFSLAIMLFFDGFITNVFGSAQAMASAMYIDSPLQVVVGALFGLIPNSVTSIALALAFVKGLISFPTFLAGMITATGLGLYALSKYNEEKNTDNSFITVVLLATAIATGLLVFYNIGFLGSFVN
jgi:hypothetical protein